MSKKKNLVQHTVPRKKKNDAKFVRIFGTNHIPISVGSCRALVEWGKPRLEGPEAPLLNSRGREEHPLLSWLIRGRQCRSLRGR